MRALVLLLVVFSSVASAEVYKWTDEKGRVHFGDRPFSENAETVQIKDNKVGSLATQSQIAQARKSKKTDLEKAEENYQKVRSGFYETRDPDSACRYAVDMQDRYNAAFQLAGKKREVYLCPKPKK